MGKGRRLTFYPERGWARVEDPRIPGWAWVGLFRQLDGRICVGTVVLDQMMGRIGNPGAGQPITMEILRAINIADVEREANRLSEQLSIIDISDAPLEDGQVDPALLPWVAGHNFEPVSTIRNTLGRVDSDPSFLQSPSKRGRRYRLASNPPPGKIPDDYLRNVVKAYHSAVTHGLKPAPTIAGDLNQEVNTVRGWIKKARQRGLMPPGRAGYTG